MRTPLALLAAAAVVGLTAAPAAAAQEIGLSRDGVTFAEQLPGPIFEPSTLWVPGDERSATFFVRNQGVSAADLTILVTEGDDGGLISSGDADLSAVAPGSVEQTPASEAADGVVLERRLAKGESVPVTLTLSYDEAADNETQDLMDGIGVNVRLAGDETAGGGVVDVGGDDGGSDGDGSDGNGNGNGNGAGSDGDAVAGTGANGAAGNRLLPDTGSPAFLGLLSLASLLLGLGLGFSFPRSTPSTPTSKDMP